MNRNPSFVEGGETMEKNHGLHAEASTDTKADVEGQAIWKCMLDSRVQA